MIVTGNVGAPQASSTPGTQTQPIRQGNLNEIIIGEVHGTYYEGTYRGGRFGGAMQAVLATATIAGVSTAVTGTSVLYNPIGSKVNLAIDKFGVGFVVAPAAPLVYGLATGWSTGALAGTLTSLNPKSKNIGSGYQPVGQLFASAAITLPVAPTVDTVLGMLDTGAVTTVTNTVNIFDLQSGIILPPGGYAVFWTSAVLAASAHIASWSWEEVPV
jgi:hypothetical protein